MTLTDQIKILDRKIKQNEVQYNLDRKATKISALSSGNLDKYKYLTGEDLNYKPSTADQAKFDYSPLSKFFNKGLKEEDKKGLLNRLKNVKNKNKEQLKIIENKIMKSQIDLFNKDLTPKAIALIKDIKRMEDNVDYKKLYFTGGKKKFTVLTVLRHLQS